MTHEHRIEALVNEPAKLTCAFKIDLKEFQNQRDGKFVYIGRVGIAEFSKDAEDFMLKKIYNEVAILLITLVIMSIYYILEGVK